VEQGGHPGGPGILVGGDDVERAHLGSPSRILGPRQGPSLCLRTTGPEIDRRWPTSHKRWRACGGPSGCDDVAGCGPAKDCATPLAVTRPLVPAIIPVTPPPGLPPPPPPRPRTRPPAP